jgi:hypothetical protein
MSTGLTAEESEFESRYDQDLNLSLTSRLALGSTQPPTQLVPWVLSAWEKRQERKPEHSPPSNIEVKKTWMYTSTSPYAVMV